MLVNLLLTLTLAEAVAVAHQEIGLEMVQVEQLVLLHTMKVVLQEARLTLMLSVDQEVQELQLQVEGIQVETEEIQA